MTEPPRQLPKSDKEKLLTLVGGRGQLLQGQSRAPLRVPPHVITQLGIDPLVIVQHGDDGAYPRPVAMLVYWIGAAEPVNGESFDFWFTANI